MKTEIEIDSVRSKSEFVHVGLPNGERVLIEAIYLDTERKVSSPTFDLGQVERQLEGIVQGVVAPLRRLAPDKLEVELGIEIAVESGALTALIVKGTGSANLRITLSWEREKDSQNTIERGGTRP
jgi:hypothetical protein